MEKFKLILKVFGLALLINLFVLGVGTIILCIPYFLGIDQSIVQNLILVVTGIWTGSWIMTVLFAIGYLKITHEGII